MQSPKKDSGGANCFGAVFITNVKGTVDKTRLKMYYLNERNNFKERLII